MLKGKFGRILDQDKPQWSRQGKSQGKHQSKSQGKPQWEPQGKPQWESQGKPQWSRQGKPQYGQDTQWSRQGNPQLDTQWRRQGKPQLDTREKRQIDPQPQTLKLPAIVEYVTPEDLTITGSTAYVNANTTIERGILGSKQVVIKKMKLITTMTDNQLGFLHNELITLSLINDRNGDKYHCLPCLSVFMIEDRIHIIFPLCICDFRIFYYQNWHFRDIFSPLIVKFIMEVVNAIQFLHSHGISHRDIKADNVLLCYNNGEFYANITDYGSSTSEEKTTRLDGTRQYMAPEVFSVIKNKERKQHRHNCLVDYWSLGILIYVIITNRLPFRDEDNTSTRVFIEWTDWLHTPGAMYMPRQSIFYKNGESSYERKNGIILPKLRLPDTAGNSKAYKFLLASMDGFMSPQPTHRLNGEGFKALARDVLPSDTDIPYDLFLRFISSLPSARVIGHKQLL